jgi:hypothetical protein
MTTTKARLRRAFVVKADREDGLGSGRAAQGPGADLSD